MESDSRKETKAPRILARQLARPLTDEEIDRVAGGKPANGGGTNCDTWCETPACGCTADCGT